MLDYDFQNATRNGNRWIVTKSPFRSKEIKIFLDFNDSILAG